MGFHSNTGVRGSAAPRRWATAIASMLALSSAAISHAQVIPPQYANALQLTEYVVLTANYNGDAYPDVLVKAVPKIVGISLDDLFIPIPLKTSSPTFALLSDSNGSYSLMANPPAALVNSPLWQAGSHDLVYGDVIGNGSNALLLRARNSGGPSFVIVTSPSGVPQLLQYLTASTIGTDLSGSAVSVSLLDSNRDGRADLLIRTNGVITGVLTAASNGLFAAPASSQDRILLAWRAFCIALDTGDMTSAARYISESSQQKYMPALTGLGQAVRTVSSTWSEPKAVTIDADYAVYLVVETVNGNPAVHLALFARSGSDWLLDDF